MNDKEKTTETSCIYGRNASIEALRSDTPIERIFVLKGCEDGPIRTILREAKKTHLRVDFVTKERLREICGDEHHQGVVVITAAYAYATVSDILAKAEQKGEPPFIFLLDEITDPHNVGAMIRTANAAGAHGVILTKHRSCGLTPVAVKTSAGAVVHTPVAQVANLSKTIEDLKSKGLWFVCADMDGEDMFSMDLSGPMGLVIGNEGKGVSPNVKKHCDFTAAIPMCGEIDSLNASVACGVLAYEIVRARKKA